MTSDTGGCVLLAIVLIHSHIPICLLVAIKTGVRHVSYFKYAYCDKELNRII